MQILESLALAVLKVQYAGYFLSEIDQISLMMKETLYSITLVLKNISLLYVFEDK